MICLEQGSPWRNLNKRSQGLLRGKLYRNRNSILKKKKEKEEIQRHRLKTPTFGFLETELASTRGKSRDKSVKVEAHQIGRSHGQNADC